MHGTNNTVGGSCYSAHQAVSRFAEHHIDMASCVHRKCQIRAGVSGDINKSFKCVTMTDSFLIEVRHDAKEYIHELGNNMT